MILSLQAVKNEQDFAMLSNSNPRPCGRGTVFASFRSKNRERGENLATYVVITFIIQHLNSLMGINSIFPSALYRHLLLGFPSLIIYPHKRSSLRQP